MPATDAMPAPLVLSPEEKQAMLRKLDAIERLLTASMGLPATVPEDAARAHAARTAGHLRGWFTVEEFAAMTGMHPRTVSSKCAARVIHTLRGGAARHRIPLSEENRWNQFSKPGAIG